MPDPAIPEAPRVTNKEALHMHNEQVVTEGIAPERLAEIQRWRRESEDPRGFLKKMAEGGATPSFSAERASDLQLSFGGGKAKKIDGTITFAGEANSIEEQRYNEAKTIIDNITNLQRYTDLLSKAASAGQTPEEFAAASTPPLNLDEIRTAGRNSINNELLQEIDPDLRGNDAAAIKEIIEIRLIQDPAFRRELATLLSQTKLPRTEISENAEAKKMSENQIVLEKRQKEATKEIENYLKPILEAEGIDLSRIKGGINGLVTRYSKLPYSAENILLDLQYDLGGLFDKYPEYNEFLGFQKQIDELAQQKIKLPANDNRRSDIDNRITELKTSFDYDSKKTTLDTDTKFTTYKRVKAALSAEKLNGTFTNPVARRVQEVVSSSAQISEIEEKLAKSQTEGGRATSTSRDERLEQERQAIEQLRGAIPQAIAKTLLERAQQADTARQRENVREFDRETREMFDHVRESLRTRGFGIEMVGGRGVRNNDRELIVHDARNLAVHKEDGLRQLTLEHMGLINYDAPVPRTNDQNEPVLDADRNPQYITSIDHLNARQRAMFDKVFASESQAIKMKVARDLMLSQSLGGKILDKLPIPGRDQNGLSSDEWEGFSEFFKNDSAKIVNATKEGRDAVAQLESAGIKPDSSRGRKILMWLAIILGGGMTIASLGGLNTIIPALAGQGVAGIKAVATGFGSGSEAIVKGA